MVRSAAEAACEAPTPTSCLAHTRVYRDGRLEASGFPVDAISDLLAEDGTVVWVDLLAPSEHDVAVLVDELGLHELAVEDALFERHQRPKLDRYRDHALLSAYAVATTPGPDGAPALQVGELAAFVTPRALVTVRKDPLLSLPDLLGRWDASAELAPSGVAFLLHGLVDLLVDGCTAVLAELDDEADELEDMLFADSQQGAALQRRSFALRKDVTVLSRRVLPLQDVLTEMVRPDSGLVDERMAPYLRDVSDHLHRAAEHVDALRELLASLLSTNLALQSNRLNETVFRLTAYAAILAVTTAVTGFFGQNVPFPGSQHWSGFLASTLLLAGSVVGLYAFFRRKGWL